MEVYTQLLMQQEHGIPSFLYRWLPATATAGNTCGWSAHAEGHATPHLTQGGG